MLAGQVALVTGASRGLGQAIALELGKQGATVVGTATTDAGAAEIQKAFYAAAIKGWGVALNVTHAADCTALIGEIEQKFGAVSVLVNNAGITRDNLAVRMKDDEWDSVLETNLKAVFRLSKAVMRGMMKARFGRIINITSVVGEAGNPGQANYAAAKAGVAGMSRALAQELGSRNITVNCVAPGIIRTRFHSDMPDERRQFNLANRIPLHREGTSEQVAEVVAMLITNDYITGETVVIDGGLTSRIV